MRPWEKIGVNEKGNMVFGGCDCVELAKEYGTPLYVLDEKAIREVCQGFVSTYERCGAKGMVYYASKALSTTAIYRIVEQEGLGVDVVSGGELYTALKAGFATKNMVFHGNNKTEAELRMAIEAGIGRIVVDSHEEIDIIADIAAKYETVVKVLIRTKPGIEAHTHDFVLTAIDDCKFGLGLYDGEALLAANQIAARKELELVGLHCHIGSQIFELEPFLIAVDRLTDFMLTVKDECGIEMTELNLGGGYGSMYTEEDAPMEPYEYVEALLTSTRDICAKKGIAEPRISIEPGRSIVAEAGITLYTVGTVKNVPGVRTFVSVDGGMGDNPRHILYGSKYTAKLANKPAANADTVVTVAGRCCESGDVLIRDAALPACERGDTLAVFTTGAYNYSMASNYNRVPIPAMVLVNNGRHGLIVRRQSYEQLVDNDMMAEWQK